MKREYCIPHTEQRHLTQYGNGWTECAKRRGKQPKIRRLVYRIGEVVDFSEILVKKADKDIRKNTSRILVKHKSRKKMIKGNQRTP